MPGFPSTGAVVGIKFSYADRAAINAIRGAALVLPAVSPSAKERGEKPEWRRTVTREELKPNHGQQVAKNRFAGVDRKSKTAPKTR